MRRASAEKPIDVVMFLQSPTPTRWVSRRKAAIVLAVRTGLISLSEASDRYSLSVDEFTSWEAAFDNRGVAGLHLKRYLRKPKEPTICETAVRRGGHVVELSGS
jgi:hypothetical protein